MLGAAAEGADGELTGWSLGAACSVGAGVAMAEAGGATVGELKAGAAGAVAVTGAAWVASGAAVGEVCGVAGGGELVIGEAAGGLTAVLVSTEGLLGLAAASSTELRAATARAARDAWIGALWTSAG